MTEMTLRSITNNGIWIPMLAPTCSTMISSDEPRCQGLNQSRIQFPLSIGMLLARDSIVGIHIGQGRGGWPPLAASRWGGGQGGGLAPKLGGAAPLGFPPTLGACALGGFGAQPT